MNDEVVKVRLIDDERHDSSTRELFSMARGLDAIFEASRDGIVVEENDHIVYANKALAYLYGYGSQAEVIGKHVSHFRAGDDDVRLLDFTRQRLAGEDAPAMYEFKGVRKDSSLFDVEVSVSSFQTAGKTFIVSTLRDITERKRSEAALKESELRYHSLFANMLEGYAYCETLFEQDQLKDFTYLQVNDAFEKLTGLRNVVGKNVSEVSAGLRETNQELLEIYGRVALTGKSEKCETYVEALGLWLSVTVYSSDKKHFVSVFDNITTRKQAENALRESDQKFHQLADHITDAFWIRSGDMRELHYISPAFERIWGRTVASLYANPHEWSNFIVPEDRQRVQAAFAELTRDAPGLDLDYRIVRPDGEIRWVRARGFQVRDAADRLIRNTGIVTDITERKRVEHALRDSEERYRELVENANDIIYTLDGDGNYTSINEAGEKILGYSMEESLARNIAQSVAPEFRKHVAQLHAAQLAGTDISAFEVEVIAKNGDRITLEVNTRLINEQGLVGGIQGIARDITERKRREVERARLLLELESEQARLVDIFTNAPAFIASLRGPDHVFELANSRYYDLVGQRDLLGRTVRDCFPDLEGQGFFELLDTAYASGVAFLGNEMPVDFASENGGPSDLRYINFVYQPLTDLEGKVSGIICHGVDVTEQVLSRRLLQETEDQLRQAQKLESVGLLAGGIAHDFNNLLTVITGHSELALTRLKNSDPLAGNLGEIKKAAYRAATLTHQLLAFSRKQVLQPKVLDLNAIIPSITEMLRRLVGEDMELVVLPGFELGRIKADPGQMEQVIINLVVNARDAMPKGGQITIETTDVYLDEDYARTHTAMSPGWHVRLKITDTGFGMDEETLKHIFEPFFTTKEQGKGTGLGLSTVYGIVKQSGGSIWVSSKVNVGTSFEIYLPNVDGEMPAPVADIPDPERAEVTETILLAEDDDMVRRLTRECLKLHGYSVLEAENGSEALRVSLQHEGPIHLLLTDVVMPHMNGKDLADQLLVQRPDTRVLYMSGYANRAIVDHGVLDGDIAFIEKPFTPDSLAHKVAEVLHPGGSNSAWR